MGLEFIAWASSLSFLCVPVSGSENECPHLSDDATRPTHAPQLPHHDGSNLEPNKLFFLSGVWPQH